jgi:hypothetical protein
MDRWPCIALALIPAVIASPGRASHSEAFKGVRVPLAEDALTRESALTIERTRPRDAQGRPLNGRDMGRPEHFRLFKVGSACVLVQESNGRRWTLTESSCVAAPT